MTTSVETKTIRKQCFCQNCRTKFMPNLTTCPKCIVNPERKPRIVVLYDAPEILDTISSSTKTFTSPQLEAVKRLLDRHVFFRCQRPTCTNLVCRRVNKNGTLDIQNHFCSTKCRDAVTGAARITRVKVPCANECGRQIERQQSDLKLAKHVYCSHQCQYEHRMKMARANKDAKALALMDQKREWARKKRKEQEEEKALKEERKRLQLALEEKQRQKEEERRLKIGHQHKCAQCATPPWRCWNTECTAKDEYSVCDKCMSRVAPELTSAAD